MGPSLICFVNKDNNENLKFLKIQKFCKSLINYEFEKN